jgi:restriction system protein
MLPTQSEVELPLLKSLLECGGQAKPRDIYPVVTTKFPQITADDLDYAGEAAASARRDP